jgi:hypothetical protein
LQSQVDRTRGRSHRWRKKQPQKAFWASWPQVRGVTWAAVWLECQEDRGRETRPTLRIEQDVGHCSTRLRKCSPDTLGFGNRLASPPHLHLLGPAGRVVIQGLACTKGPESRPSQAGQHNVAYRLPFLHILQGRSLRLRTGGWVQVPPPCK